MPLSVWPITIVNGPAPNWELASLQRIRLESCETPKNVKWNKRRQQKEGWAIAFRGHRMPNLLQHSVASAEVGKGSNIDIFLAQVAGASLALAA